MSLSDGNNYAHNWFAQDGGVGQQITDLIGQLDALNIPVVAATGNSFTGQQGEGFTAIVAGTISVTATDASDQLAAERPAAGRGDRRRLGDRRRRARARDSSPRRATTSSRRSTAPASPPRWSPARSSCSSRSTSRGSARCRPSISSTSWLQQGADPIHDPVTGITIGRLDIPKAAGLIPPARRSRRRPAPPVPPPTPAPDVAGPDARAAPTRPGSTPTPAPAPSPTPTRPARRLRVDVDRRRPTPTPTPPTPAPTSQVFINGQPVSSPTAESSTLTPLSQSRFDALLKAMSAWASSDGNAGGSRVEPGQDLERDLASGRCRPHGSAYPAGSLSLLTSRLRARVVGSSERRLAWIDVRSRPGVTAPRPVP